MSTGHEYELTPPKGKSSATGDNSFNWALTPTPQTKDVQPRVEVLDTPTSSSSTAKSSVDVVMSTSQSSSNHKGKSSARKKNNKTDVRRQILSSPKASPVKSPELEVASTPAPVEPAAPASPEKVPEDFVSKKSSNTSAPIDSPVASPVQSPRKTENKPLLGSDDSGKPDSASPEKSPEQSPRKPELEQQIDQTRKLIEAAAAEEKDQLNVKLNALTCSNQTDAQKLETLKLMNAMLSTKDAQSADAFYQHVDELYLKPSASPKLRVLGLILIGLAVSLLLTAAALLLAASYAPAMAVATTYLTPALLPKLSIASIACAGTGVVSGAVGVGLLFGSRPSSLARNLAVRDQESVSPKSVK